jgi:iron complex outermembrane receptor protein
MMQFHGSFHKLPKFIVGSLIAVHSLAAQSTGSIEGTITLAATGDALHGAQVQIVELGQTATSGQDGKYIFSEVPPGAYHLVTHLDSTFTDDTKAVTVSAGGAAAVDFALSLAPEKFEVTVTASGREETTFESFQSVESLNSFDLAGSTSASMGELLDQRPGSGIAKRSFGPGSSRPIIRGFDGDRVLVMQDGMRTGTLSSQSGDHGELVNPALLDRLEVVKGPATLLYGSSAMGGVVNAVSRHHAFHEHAHTGLRGFASGSGGSANSLGGASAGFEYGFGKWTIWAGGGGLRTGDYSTPEGEIFNSRTRTANGYAGLGWYGDKTFASFSFEQDDGRYGIPFAASFEAEEGGEEEIPAEETTESEEERIEIDMKRQAAQFTWGVRGLGPALDNFRLQLNYTQYEHQEVEIAGGQSTIGTAFDNDQFVYRGVFEQAKRGPLSGQFGFWGLARDYDVTGAEALSPPVDQDVIAVFGLEELAFERVKFQFGGRLERTNYDPLGLSPRDFTGASAAAGVHFDLWNGGAFVSNYSHSYRAPALEELYNNGPHIGNLAFEVGNPDLQAETGNGVDVSLRHQSARARGELNLFYYRFHDFVFPFLTGEVEDGLRVVNFIQTGSRFTGAEASVGLALHSSLWLNLGMDFVDAQETENGTPLPRIPPIRGKAGLEFMRGGLNIKPEIVIAGDQHQTFTGETRTPGYTVLNLKASYTIPQQHLAHQFAAEVFNVGDRLYRNHSSFIKDLAPEIGRGVKFTYMVRFF